MRAALGTRLELTLDRAPSRHRARTHTPTHPDRDDADMPIRLACSAFTMWEEAGAPEKTHADRRGGGCEKATRTVTLAEDLRFFFVINVTMNETMLLEPLL